MVKEKSKGQKQVLEENASTIFFYRIMSLGAMGVYMFSCWLLFNNYSATDQIMLVVSACGLLACNRFLASMARTKVSETGALLDEGCDLNMEGGLAEHVKDAIILMVTSLVLSTISSYFWLMLLLAPARACQMLWSSVLKPWIFSSNDQPSAEEAELLDEKAQKKQKKLERRQRRGY